MSNFQVRSSTSNYLLFYNLVHLAWCKHLQVVQYIRLFANVMRRFLTLSPHSDFRHLNELLCHTIFKQKKSTGQNINISIWLGFSKSWFLTLFCGRHEYVISHAISCFYSTKGVPNTDCWSAHGCILRNYKQVTKHHTPIIKVYFSVPHSLTNSKTFILPLPSVKRCVTKKVNSLKALSCW